jgi:membrane protein DedA with SNARE-associated domain
MGGSVRSPPVTGVSRGEGEDRRIPLPWLITPIVVLALTGTVADILGPKLIVEHPQLQMFLNPRNRYMILAAATVQAVPFFVIGFVRLVLTDPLGYVLGRQYGEAALKWAGEKMGDEGRFIRRVERFFGKAAPVIILIAPNLYMCILAGASGMKARVFVALNVAGTIGRLVLFRIAGHAFRDELLDLVDWIGRNQKWLIIASFVVVVLQSARSRKRGTLETPAEIEREIEQAEAEIEAEERPQP